MDAPPPAHLIQPATKRSVGVAPLLGLIALGGLLAATALPSDAPYAPALLVPAGIAGVIAVAAHPAAGVVALFALTGFQGSIQVYTPIPGRGLVDFILVALWLGALWRALNFKNPPIWLLPGVVAAGLYIAFTIIAALFTSPVSEGVASIHLSVWLMAAVLLVGMAPWSSEVIWGIAKGALVVAVLVGLYAVLRTITGPTEAERELALSGKPGFLQLKTSGSLPSAGHLASWSTAMLPFALALTLALRRGFWQYVAGLAAALSLFAVLATEVRAGIVAAIGAAFLVLVLFGASRAFPITTRTVRLAGGCLIAVVLGAGAYATTIGTSGESSARFERILDPTNDLGYSTRLVRWEEAIEVMGDNPFGKGLGTLGAVALDDPLDPDLIRQLDSSYIKVGVEQGPWVLGLFVLGLLALLANLAWRSIIVTDPGKAALGIAGAGALLGMIISFYANTFIEEPQILAGWLIAGLGVAMVSRPSQAEDSTAASGGAPPLAGTAS
jgi:hypothetical protein